MGRKRNATLAQKDEITELATAVKKEMKPGDKKPPAIAKAINALLKKRQGREFEYNTLRSQISNWKLHEDETPDQYRWSSLDGPQIVNLPREDRTHPVHGPQLVVDCSLLVASAAAVQSHRCPPRAVQ